MVHLTVTHAIINQTRIYYKAQGVKPELHSTAIHGVVERLDTDLIVRCVPEEPHHGVDRIGCHRGFLDPHTVGRLLEDHHLWVYHPQDHYMQVYHQTTGDHRPQDHQHTGAHHLLG
jgi:hypothetical protein